jgi:hypothetical protein
MASRTGNSYLNRLALTLFLSVCLLLLFIFSKTGKECAEFPDWMERPLKPVHSEKRYLEAAFKTSVEVSAKCTYPRIRGKGSFIGYVNKKLEKVATDLFEKFLEEEKRSKEVHNNDFGGCYLDYERIYRICYLVVASQ